MNTGESKRPPSAGGTALRICLIYAGVAVVWIVLSDWAVLRLTGESAAVHIQTVKGGLFVAVTAALLFVLVRRSLLSMAAAERVLDEKERSLRQSEERYRYLFEKNPHPMWVYDRQTLRFLAVNEAALEHYGYSRQEFLSLTIKEIRPEDDVPALLERISQPTAGVARAGVWRHRKKDGSLIDVEIITHALDFERRPAKLVLAHDVTEEVRSQESLRRLNRTLRVLSLCNESLVRARKEKELLNAVCHILVETGGYPLVWVGFVSPGAGPGIRPVAHAGEDSGYLATLAVPLSAAVSCAAGPCLKLHQGVPPVVEKLADGEGCPHCRIMAAALGLKAALGLPLLVNDERIGCLMIYSRAEGFDSEEIKLLTELSEDLAYGIVSLRTAAARRQAEESLRLRNRAIEASSNGIMICDAATPEMPILYVNPAFERITGYGADEVLGRSPNLLAGVEAEQKGLVDIRERLRLGEETEVVVRNYRKDGSSFWNELSVAPVRDADGRVTHFVGILDDVTERKRYEEQLAHQANYDALTDLANRNLLADRLQQSIVYADRSHRLVAVVLLDLDRFKIINDSLGHGQGDVLLQRVAERLRGCVRAADTVARLGGDEFVLALAEVAEAEDVGLLAKKIQNALSRPFTVAGRELYVTASIGISLYPADGRDGESLVRQADIAMYRAKEEGGNTFRFFSPEMNLHIMETLDLEADLRRAVERQEFVLHYQPKVDLASGRITSCEALVRWRHPEKGMIFPGAFIPLAEETGLIVPLGDWVLRTACAQNRQWQQEGLPPISVATNLSARQFREANLVETVQRTLRETGLEPQCLSLEVTESLIMKDPAGAVQVMNRFKELGIGLSLDDFGTGYSSLNYLRHFPVDCLKIDRSFITDVTADPSAAAVATSVVAIAHSLGLQAVAEGVETRAQLDFLRHCRCDGLQGYLFSRPVPAEAFASLLSEGRRLEG